VIACNLFLAVGVVILHQACEGLLGSIRGLVASAAPHQIPDGYLPTFRPNKFDEFPMFPLFIGLPECNVNAASFLREPFR
jgi:hypothetical protein